MADLATIDNAAADEAAQPEGGRTKDVGLRRCVVTRAKRPREALLRFVLDPDGVVVPDVAARLPGRGVWVTPDLAILQKAIRNGRFAAGFKTAARTPDDLVERTRALLDRRIGEVLGMARGAGQVAAGWEQARDFARRHRIGLVVVASDAAAPSRRRLEGLAQGAPVLDMLDAETLGRVLGREQVVNALVSQGRFAEMIACEAARRRGLGDEVNDGAAATTPGGEG